jgi:hypothetical protein
MVFLHEEEDQGKPVRVSGAFDLDMSKVVEEAAKRAAEQVIKQVAPVAGQVATVYQDLVQALMPALVQIHKAVENTAGLMFPAGLMSREDSVATLTSMLPAGFLSGAATAEQVAGFQHERLAEAGYAVVPVAGAALEHAIKVAQHRQRLAEQGPAQPAWYDMRTSAEAGGPKDQEVAHQEQVARADARLAEESAAGVYGAWHEDQH